MNLEIKGADELTKKLESLSKKDLKAAIRTGTRQGAKVVQARAKELAPVQTGFLKKNLKVRALPRSKKWIGAAVKLDYTGETFYGAFVEYGTKYIRPRGFLKEAVKQVKQQAVETALIIIQQTIEAKSAT